MDNEKLRKLRELIDDVANASTKKNAAHYVQKLDSMVASIIGDLNGYTAGKLTEAVSYAKHASGQVSNRENLLSSMRNSWAVFESDVINGDSGKHKIVEQNDLPKH